MLAIKMKRENLKYIMSTFIAVACVVIIIQFQKGDYNYGFINRNHTGYYLCMTSMLAAGMFMFSKKWGGIAFIYPFMIGLSRVCLCVHYFTDVLVGWVVGAGVAIAVFYVLNWIIKYYVTKKENGNGK